MRTAYATRVSEPGTRNPTEVRAEVERISDEARRVLAEEGAAAALQIAQRALAAAGDSLRDDPVLATCLETLGEIERLTGDAASGIPHLRDALRIRRLQAEEAPKALGVSVNNLGLALTEVGAFDEAKMFLSEAVDLATACHGPASRDFALSLTNLALCCGDSGALSRAEELYGDALRVWRACGATDDEGLAAALDGIGAVFIEQHRYDAAARVFEEALDIRRRTLRNNLDIATSLNNLGIARHRQGDHAEARRLLEEALAIDRSAHSGAASDASALNNLANVYRAIGDLARARDLYSEAVAVERARGRGAHPDLAAILDSLAGVCTEEREPGAAEPLVEEALAIRRSALAPDDPFVARTVYALAVVREMLGRHDEAERLYRESLDLARKGRKDARVLADVLDGLGDLYVDWGRYTEAEPVLREAIRLRRQVCGAEHASLVVGLEALASLLAATQRLDQALDTADEAVAVEDRFVRRALAVGSESQRLTLLEGNYCTLEYYVSLLSLVPHDAAAARRGLDVVLRRKGLALEALVAQREALLAGRYPKLESDLHRLHELRKTIAEAELEGVSNGELPEHAQDIAAFKQELERIEVRLAREIPEIRLDRVMAGATTSAVADALPPGAALVEIVRARRYAFGAVTVNAIPRWLPAFYGAFVLQHGRAGAVQWIELGPAAPIDEAVEELRREIGRRRAAKDGRFDVGLNTPLRRLVVDPLVAAVGTCRRLFVSPAGPLTRMPLEILPLDEHRRVIDVYTVSYLGAGRDLLRAGQEDTGNRSNPPVVVGDPRFDQGCGLAEALRRWIARVTGHPQQAARDGGDSPQRAGQPLETLKPLVALKGAREEARRVASILGVQPWVGRDATKARLLKLSSPKVLHIATHGYFLTGRTSSDVAPTPDGAAGMMPGSARVRASEQRNPLLQSGLALAGANTWLRGMVPAPEIGNGILTAEEVTSLSLSGTELVVLSACDTGLGGIKDGEGVFGLARSFVLAGARTVVASVWKVPDAATCQLMEEFYRRLGSTRDHAEALRSAVLALRATHPHPKAWGGFLCQGDTWAASEFVEGGRQVE